MKINGVLGRLQAMNSRIKYLPALFWGLFGWVLLKMLSTPLYDPDMWWHLTAGRHMIENQSLLRTDIFSHTFYGAPWINFEWLSQVLMALSMDWLGVKGPYCGKIFLGLIAVLFLIWSTRTMGLKGPWLYLLSWGGLHVLRPRLLERPELFTLIFFPLLVMVLARVRNCKPREQTWVPWSVGLIMLVWVNLHAGFIYGLGFVVLFNLGARWARESKSTLTVLNRCLVAGLIGVMLNPYGPKIAIVFFEHLKQLSGSESLIQEWQETTVAAVPAFWVFFLGTGIVIVWGLVKTRLKAVPLWAPAVLVFGVWGSLFYRNTALFIFVALPFLGSVLSTREWTGKAVKLGWILCLIPVLAHASFLTKPFPKNFVSWRKVPVRAAQFVIDYKVQGTMYNSYEIGGYLGWALYKKAKVFMDGRYLFYPVVQDVVQLNSYGDRLFREKQWAEYLEAYKITHAVVSYPFLEMREDLSYTVTPLDVMFPRKNWALVFWDDVGLVFLKRTSENRNLIRDLEFKVLYPYNPDRMRHLILSKKVSLALVQKELVRQTKRTGFTYPGFQIHKILQEALGN